MSLGRVTSKALGPLTIGPGASSGFECNLVGADLASGLQAKHPKVFDGVGKLKEYKLKFSHRSRRDTNNSEAKVCPICTA